MVFCSNCGVQLQEGAKFCSECGTPVVDSIATTVERKTIYEGEIHKCPYCGEMLDSFLAYCPACGHEIRGSKVSETVREFAKKLAEINDEQQKIMIIKSFPVPNTKEDILEFMVLAATNIEGKDGLSKAWQVKMEQVYKKANMLFKDDSNFIEIQEIYLNENEKIAKLDQLDKKKNIKKIFSELISILPNLIFIFGWLLCLFVLIPFCGVGVDSVGTNGQQVFFGLMLLFGVFIIPRFTRVEISLPRLIVSFGLLLSIIILLFESRKNVDYLGTNAIEIIMFLDIACSIILFLRMNKHKVGANCKNEGGYFVIATGTTVVLLIAYCISGLFVAFNEDKTSNSSAFDVLDIDKKYDEVYIWPEEGLCMYVPQPSSSNGKITENSQSAFSFYVYRFSETQYENYLEECVSRGFCIDAESYGKAYYAYNSEGHKLSLNYNDIQMTVTVKAPMEMKDISWPVTGITENLPKPQSSIGKISSESSDTFWVYIGDMTIDAYNEYVDICLKEGFDIDYTRYDEYFHAENKNGDKLTVSYEGNNIVYIQIYNWD